MAWYYNFYFKKHTKKEGFYNYTSNLKKNDTIILFFEILTWV